MSLVSLVVFIILYLTNIQCSEENEHLDYDNLKKDLDVQYDDHENIGDSNIDNHKATELFESGVFSLGQKTKFPERGFQLTEEEMKKFKIWPKGIIPYYIDDISFDNSLRERLRNILQEFNHLTGSLSFTELSAPPEDKNERWVLFINRVGALTCQDYTTKDFTESGVQHVVLGYDCLGAGGGALPGIVLALVGVPPQHNSPDRDDYISVVMDNILPEKRDLFQKLQDNEWLFHDLPYDFISAGHYSLHQYSINGSATIIPKTKGYVRYSIGEKDGISPEDIWKIKILYNFISSAREKVKASDCSQIFKPGSKFDSAQLLPDKLQNYNFEPRQKPSKYLGNAIFHKHNTKKSPRKDKLSHLLDFDTDEEGKKNNRPMYLGRRRPKASVCSQIFRPGSKFFSIRHLPDKLKNDNFAPRQKPSKYLGTLLTDSIMEKKKHQVSYMEDFDTDR
ncbi:hypothetical protein O0L34_g3896 [Tuta absoluta]|nr:hypothetical protein O0L34_g3896 [Tuta absoluta]